MTFYRALNPKQQREIAWFQSRDGATFLNVLDGSAQTRVVLNDVELAFVDPAAAPGEKRPAHLWALPRGSEKSSYEVTLYFEDGRIVREDV